MGKPRHRVVMPLVQGTQLVSTFLGGRLLWAGPGLSLGLSPLDCGPGVVAWVHLVLRPGHFGLPLSPHPACSPWDHPADSQASASSALQEADPDVLAINSSHSGGQEAASHGTCALAAAPLLQHLPELCFSWWECQGASVRAPWTLFCRFAV